MSKRIKMLLCASLALNVAFASMFLGHMSHRYLWMHLSHRFSGEPLKRLPEEKRKLFEDTMHAAWVGMEDMRAQLADARKEAARLLAAEPFSEEDYLTQMQRLNDLQARMKRRMSEAMANLAKQFTPEERAALSEIVSRPPPDMRPKEESPKEERR